MYANWVSGAGACPRLVLPHPALGINLHSPFLHGFLGGEFDDEVLDSRVALPEDLAGV